tara:strand:- start:907 stop:1656 length:750 start_codon:yes stop_codon:yes gene_type:complete
MIAYPNAKINIGLNILRKREDGYHDIESIFYPIHNLIDILEIVPANSFSIKTTGLEIPSGLNICEKAYLVLKEDFNIPYVHIHLHKQIPIGSGLGGGSSDGAFTLKILNKLFRLNIDQYNLEKYAKRIGSDCTFFIDNKPKYVEGVGDKLSPIDLDLSLYEIRLSMPNIHVSTENAYSKIIANEKENTLYSDIFTPISVWKKSIKNDFESSIFRRYPEIRDIKKDFYQKGAVYSSMTGTGSAVYGIFSR